MPFFKRSNKPPKRRLDAGNTTLSKSNLSLAGTGELAESVNNALVKLKLGRHELMFQDGEWIAGEIEKQLRAPNLISVFCEKFKDRFPQS